MHRIIICLGFSLLTIISPKVSFGAGNWVQTDPKFITHKVTSGETMYSLARKYGVSVTEISKLNPSTKAGLKAGQVLKIPAKNAGAATVEVVEKPAAPETKPVPPVSKPLTPAKPAAETPAKATPAANAASGTGDRKMHKVGPKQTLYSVAVQHGVTMAELRKWNNLKADKLTVGQTLIVSAPETKPVAQPAETPAQTVVKNDVKVKTDKVKTETKTETAVPVTVVEKANDEDEESSTIEAAGKITETGMAEVITTPGDNNKYLALHKTAPIGTILQVKNIMNGQNVYVRVIGKLPETGANERIIVRISKKAYQRLAAIDNRFRVEVSYMP